MQYRFIILVLLLSGCQQGAKEKNTPQTIVREIESAENKADTLETHKAPTEFKSRLRPNQPIFFHKTYTDTLEFKDYNDDFDDRYVRGLKNGAEVSLIYNWDWTNNQNYNFRQGDLIAVQWKMDSIVAAGDEEVVNVAERAIAAKRIAPGNQPIQFLEREDRYDESVQDTVSSMVINQTYLHNITLPQKAALGYISFDIGNECEWGYDNTGNKRVLWCQIVSALDLGHQCSETQLNFLRKWFAKDTVALKKLERCPTMPNTATIQTTFDEIQIQTDESQKTITVDYKVTGINMRESSSWQYSRTDVFEYGAEHIVLVDSKKLDLTEDEIGLNPDDANLGNQEIISALKNYPIKEWRANKQSNPQNVSFQSHDRELKGAEGFPLSRYDFNDIQVKKDEKTGARFVTVYNAGGGGGGNVLIEKEYVVTVIDPNNIHIEKGKIQALD